MYDWIALYYINWLYICYILWIFGKREFLLTVLSKNNPNAVMNKRPWLWWGSIVCVALRHIHTHTVCIPFSSVSRLILVLTIVRVFVSVCVCVSRFVARAQSERRNNTSCAANRPARRKLSRCAVRVGKKERGRIAAAIQKYTP